MAKKDDMHYINMLLEETENEVLGGESSDEEQDIVENNEHNSETEQSDSDSEPDNLSDEAETYAEPMDLLEDTGNMANVNIVNNDMCIDTDSVDYTKQCCSELNLDPYSSEEDELPYSQRVSCFFGKTKKNQKGEVIEPPAKWHRKPPPQNIRTPARNIVIHLPGVKAAAKNATTPIQAWNCLFDNDMLYHIVSCTNKYIQKKKNDFSRERDSNDTNIDEIKAFIGVLYICGAMKSSHNNTGDIWAKDGTGLDIVMCTMSKSRFHFLLQVIRFDDISTRAIRKQIDKITHVREIFEKVVSNSQQAYTISEYATLDEHLEGFRGRCSFRQYIRNKPAKYGIKIFMLCDARTFFTNNMEIYAGTQPDGPYKISNAVPDVVKRMIRPISGTNRNLTVDNWFTSVPLAIDLLKNHKVTMVGTIRKDKREIPSEFKTTKDRSVCSSIFGFHEEKMTLVSYAPNKKKVVLGLSTMHYNKEIDNSTGEQKKPEIITFYNTTKGGVDVVDRLCANYSTGRTSNRWPLTVFFFLLDIVGINSQIIYEANSGDKIPRRVFLKNIGKILISNHLNYRSTIMTLPKDLKTRIQLQLGQPQRQRQLVRKNAR